MKNKLIFIFTLIFLASAVNAATIDLNPNNIRNNNLVQDGSVYKIIDDKNIIFTPRGGNGMEYRRIIVENTTRIEELNQIISGLEKEMQSLDVQLADLQNRTAELESEKTIWENAVVSLTQQRDALKEALTSLETQRDDAKNKITSNIIATPLSYQSALALLVVLVVVVVGVKAREFMKK